MNEEERGAGQIEVNVSLPEDASPEEVEQLAERLAAAGMRVEQTLPAIGAITGAIDDSVTVDALQAIAGPDVRVEEGRRYQHPPPDEPVQ